MPGRVKKRQWDQKEGHDQHCRPRELSAGQTVWVRHPGIGRSWFPGTISKVLSQQRFRIALEDGRVVDLFCTLVTLLLAVFKTLPPLQCLTSRS